MKLLNRDSIFKLGRGEVKVNNCSLKMTNFVIMISADFNIKIPIL